MIVRAEKRKKVLKWVITAEIIIFYMAVLTVVSYIRGPGRFEAVKQTLLTSESFVSFDGEPAGPGDVLSLKNAAPGTAVGYQAEVDLADRDAIQISFHTECPEIYAGSVLHIDLYDPETGYDGPEQEYEMVMQAGENEAAFMLDPGPEHPETAQLRFFTLDRADYQLEGLEILRAKALPKLTTGGWAGVALCFLLLAGTAAYAILPRRKN